MAVKKRYGWVREPWGGGGAHMEREELFVKAMDKTQGLGKE